MRTKLFKTGVLMFTALLMAVSVSYGGAWTAGQNKFYNRLAFNYYYAEKEFDPDGDRADFAANGSFTDINVSNYFEYGVTDTITVFNSLYYKYLEKEDDIQKTETCGFGDIDLGIRFRVSESKWGVVSFQGMVKIPEAYDEDDPVPLGNGQYDTEIRLLYGRSLYPVIPGYFNAEIAYRWRFEDPSDEIRYLLEFGLDMAKNLYGRIKLDGIVSADNGQHSDFSGNPATTNNYDLGKLDMCIGYKFSPSWGLEFAYTPEIYGQNTASGATYILAISFQTP